MGQNHFWTIILAAGDGTRVSSLTTVGQGPSVPKQFFAPDGEESMLRWTIRRAKQFVPKERIVVVVAAAHRAWWEKDLADLPVANVIVQPLNRGTAAGVLLPLLAIVRRDPAAKVLVMPSDHHVEDEMVLREAILDAIQTTHTLADHIMLLGMVPDDLDRDYGWIVPGDSVDGGTTRHVEVFVEKPDGAKARLLARRGALWNSFIFVASAKAMLSLYESAMPNLARTLSLPPRDGGGMTLDAVYGTLPTCDFSREVLQPLPERLQVLPVPRCGWSDLGTPERLERYRSGLRASVPGSSVQVRR